jgi:galactose oxidase
MGVLLQGFYKIRPDGAVPSPADGDETVLWWWDHLAVQANALRQAGFTAIWLPPVLKAAEGSGAEALGYSTFDDYDLGSRNQRGGTPTRYGIREQLQRCAAVFRANGLDVYLDIVEHQRSGDVTPFVFRYPGADGTANAGRFPKDPSNFVPQVPRDPNLGGPPADDVPFGRELAPINGLPAHYVSTNLTAACDWLTRALGVQGFRIDNVKGLSTDFLKSLLQSQSMAGKFAVGEFFDGNVNLVNQWVFNPAGMQGRCSAFDFPLKFILGSICNNPGGSDMSALDHAGLAGVSPLNAVTFVENHDTDQEPGQSIATNKALAYAYILTSEGYPCVYYRDYSTDPDCYGLKPQIDNLIWIHEKLANGPTQQRWKDFNVFAYERLGGVHLLVGLNNDPNNPRTITVATGFGPKVSLHDYTGHGSDIFTDGNGNATITIPRNVNGLGYVCYSIQNQNSVFDVTPLPVKQDFDGAPDLDILPALNGTPVKVGRIWCAAASTVSATLTPDTTGWTAATTIAIELLAPDGSVLANELFSLATPAGAVLQATAGGEGFYTFQLTSSNTPATNVNPAFRLSTSYAAPSVLTPAAATQSNPIIPAGNLAVTGQWSEVIQLPNVPVHLHVLPTGKVLFWGRRNPPGTTPNNADFPSLNQRSTTAYLWDPANPNATQTTSNSPTDSQGNPINVFCSGHTFLPDGRLLVAGGHLFDGLGINNTTIYDPVTDRWTPAETMNEGRWYPTVVTLFDGSVLVCSGSFPTGPVQAPPNQSAINNIQQIWNNGPWISIVDFNGLPLFPRLHLAPDGRVFMAGGLAQSFFLDPTNGGTWFPGPFRNAKARDYAPSVMYDIGKVIFIGGGLDVNNDQNGPPTNLVETIDLNTQNPQWVATSSMQFPRRQHNATLLADGTVLVTGGTQGTGFNDLDAGAPVHTAELWNPADGTWQQMAAEAMDRCYHATAVLLPDGRVLSAGGGEFAADINVSSLPKDNHANGQIFSPPYLFKGARPIIAQAPTEITYGETFVVQTPAPSAISQVTFLRLGSVTHSFDQNQRINFLTFVAGNGQLTVTAPANGKLCPPGHYLLFLLNQEKVPSVATIIKIGAAVPAAAVAQAEPAMLRVKTTLSEPLFTAHPSPVLNSFEQDKAIQTHEKTYPIVVGVTPTCPYGISACWGGAYEALGHLAGVRLVRPIPNAVDSTAYVYLRDDGLPAINEWPTQFAAVANGIYRFRGVEVTIQGVVQPVHDGSTLSIPGNGVRPLLLLQPILAADKIQWDLATKRLKPLDSQEENAFLRLQQMARNASGPIQAKVTGPLKKLASRYVLEVRDFSVS